jgi:hypothetical protein
MKHAAMAMTVLGWISMFAAASEPPARVASPYFSGNAGAAYTPWGAVARTSYAAPMSPPMMGQTYGVGCDACAAAGHRGDRLHQLTEFLFFRPTIPCDWCPRPTEWQPPLYARFPNICHASMGCGTEGCGRGCHGRLPKGGCGACAATLGTPMANRPLNVQSTAQYPEANLLPAAFDAKGQSSPYLQLPSQSLPKRP